MTTIPLQTILAAIPSRVVAVLRDHEHSAADLVRHLTYCYAMLPTTPRGVQFDGADQNRLCREFHRDYCGEDGAVDWEKLLALNVGTGVEVKRGHVAPDLELEEESATCCKSCRRHYDLREGDEPTKYCDPCAQIAVERLESELRESEAGAAAMREKLEWCLKKLVKVEGTRQQIEHALSADAGRELLAEVERLRLKAADRDEWQNVAMKVSTERDALQRKVKAAEGMVEALKRVKRMNSNTPGQRLQDLKENFVESALADWQEANK